MKKPDYTMDNSIDKNLDTSDDIVAKKPDKSIDKKIINLLIKM